jgi:hypothetical protein
MYSIYGLTYNASIICSHGNLADKLVPRENTKKKTVSFSYLLEFIDGST